MVDKSLGWTYSLFAPIFRTKALKGVALGGSDFLFIRPSFLNGMAKAIDVTASMDDYNISPTPEEADARALHADWQEIGRDLKIVLEKVTRAHE
ncbi:MAG: hypothetical protein ACLQCB_09510 [Spirochaetia bacterium]